MNGKKRVACFFTAGYTELNAMKSFLGKINDKVELIQLCPIGPRKSKRAIQDRHINQIVKEQNGMTGKKLIEFVVDFIGGKRFEEEGYEAVLIEDDKDDRFLFAQDDGTAIIDDEKWICFKGEVIELLHKKYPGMPVVFFYAAPEIEAWFLADWKNGFGSVYKGIYSGYFGGKYRKLSGEIQSAIQEIDFLEDYKPGKEHPKISYSKNKQGGSMLENIDPEVVLQKCPFFFKEGYQGLKVL